MLPGEFLKREYKNNGLKGVLAPNANFSREHFGNETYRRAMMDRYRSKNQSIIITQKNEILPVLRTIVMFWL
jgi:hypothetical protein